MGQNTTIRKITDKETLDKVINNLKREEEFIIDMKPLEFLKILKNHEISYSRVGFKKWALCSKIKEREETSKSTVIFRLTCFVCSVILFILLIYELLSLFWIRLESYFVSLPLASGIISGVILIIISLLGRLFKKSPLIVLKTYLGVTENVRARRRN